MGFAVTVGHSVQKSESEAVIKGNFPLPYSTLCFMSHYIFFFFWRGIIVKEKKCFDNSW